MTTTRIRKLALAAIAAAALSFSWGATNIITGDPSQWGQEARKVNEYEGQHRIAGDHSQGEVAKKGSFDITELDGQRVAKVNEYEGQHRIAGDPSQWG